MRTEAAPGAEKPASDPTASAMRPIRCSRVIPGCCRSTSVRHVGNLFTTDENTVSMLAYTTADLFAFVDLPKGVAFPSADTTRVTFRVKNVTDKQYAIWSDPFYPDQIFLGAPRSYEVSASVRF